MPAVIKSLLVGIGFKADKKGARQISSTIDGIQKKVLKLGTITAGAFGFQKLTSGFAQFNDTMGKFIELYGGTADETAAIGRALVKEGGSLAEAFGMIKNLADLRAGLIIGEADIISSAEKAGLVTSGIFKATTAYEALLYILRQIEGLTKDQRLNVIKTGLVSESAVRLAAKGDVRGAVQYELDRRQVTEEDTAGGARFNNEMADLQTNFGNIADSISRLIDGPLLNLLEWTNDMLESPIIRYMTGLEQKDEAAPSPTSLPPTDLKAKLRQDEIESGRRWPDGTPKSSEEMQHPNAKQATLNLTVNSHIDGHAVASTNERYSYNPLYGELTTGGNLA